MKLVLGTVQFGLDYGINNKAGAPDFDEVIQILDLAHTSGIRILDTAAKYGNAHAVIGNYHKQSQNRFQIITKFDFDKNQKDFSIIKSVEKYIEELNVSTLNCCMFHSFSDLKKYYTQNENELNRALNAGIIERIGVSVYTNEEIKEALNYSLISVIQLPFNLLDNKNKRGEHIDLAKKKGIEIHTRSAFLQGLFFVDQEKLKVNLSPLKDALSELHEICHRQKLDMADLALKYALSEERIDQVLIGVDNVGQLQKNLKALNTKIDSSIFSSINEIDVENIRLLNPSNW